MMKKQREAELKQQRKDYIRTRVSAVKNKATEVIRISKELFISTDTVYRDLRD